MLSNIDSIFFSLDFNEYDNNNQDLIKNLELAKEQSKENKLNETIIDLAGKKFVILPNGARFHAYILHNDSMELKIAHGRSSSLTNYPVSIRIKSLKLWEDGFISAYEDTIETVKSIIKGEIIAEKISRADMCVHVDNFKLDNLNELYHSWRGTFRKVEHYFYNRKLNGITFGTFQDKNVMCRIYDKSLEIKSSNKLWFKTIWTKAGMDPENVWNIEYQIGRKYFKDREIETVTEFVVHMRGIWEELTTKFVSFIEQTDNNISRCPLKPEWEQITKAYQTYYQKVPIKREKQLNKRSEALIPLLIGVLTSYGACNLNVNMDKLFHQIKTDTKEYLHDRKDNIPIEQIILDKIEYMYS